MYRAKERVDSQESIVDDERVELSESIVQPERVAPVESIDVAERVEDQERYSRSLNESRAPKVSTTANAL